MSPAPMLSCREAHVTTPNLSEGSVSELGLVRYDAMCNAIAECFHVDEAKELRNQARALEVYAAQAMNMEAERKACEIRIRAERRAGELLKATKVSGERQKPGDNRTGVDSRVARPSKTRLADLGISKDQSSQWQQLADIPEEEFEEALSKPGPKPSTEGLVNAKRIKQDPVPPFSNDALWLWDKVKDFEREGVFDKDPNILLSRMLDTMREDIARLLPRVCAWLGGMRCDRDEAGRVFEPPEKAGPKNAARADPAARRGGDDAHFSW